LAERTDVEPADAGDPGTWTRSYFGDANPEIRSVLEATVGMPPSGSEEIPSAVLDVLGRLEVSYYRGDAVEITSLELNKVAGVEAALDVLGVEDPFALVMGDSRSDLRVMEWAEDADAGVAAAPSHASRAVLDHVVSTDELVFEEGGAGGMLRAVYAMDQLARLDLDVGGGRDGESARSR